MYKTKYKKSTLRLLKSMGYTLDETIYIYPGDKRITIGKGEPKIHQYVDGAELADLYRHDKL